MINLVFVHLSIYIGKMDKWTWTSYTSDLFRIFVIVVLLLYPSSSAISCRVFPSERIVRASSAQFTMGFCSLNSSS